MNKRYTKEEVVRAIITEDKTVYADVFADLEYYKDMINADDAIDGIICTMIDCVDKDFLIGILPIIDYIRKSKVNGQLMVGLLRGARRGDVGFGSNEVLLDIAIDYVVTNNLPYSVWSGGVGVFGSYLQGLDREEYNVLTVEVLKQPYGDGFKILKYMDEQLDNNDCFWYFNKMLTYCPTSKQQEMILDIKNHLHTVTDDLTTFKSRLVQMLYVYDENIDIHQYHHIRTGLDRSLIEILSTRVEKEILKKELPMSVNNRVGLKL